MAIKINSCCKTVIHLYRVFSHFVGPCFSFEQDRSFEYQHGYVEDETRSGIVIETYFRHCVYCAARVLFYIACFKPVVYFVCGRVFIKWTRHSTWIDVHVKRRPFVPRNLKYTKLYENH